MRKFITGGSDVITLTEAKLFLKVDVTDDDTLIIEQITTARLWAEKYMNRQLVSATYDLYLDKFKNPIELYACPASDVVYIKYYDSNGDLQTLSSDTYTVDVVSEPGRVALAPDYSWPDTDNRINAVVVRYVSGWADASEVPSMIKSGILLVVGHLYENRQAVTKDVFRELPLGAKYLFDFYKVY